MSAGAALLTSAVPSAAGSAVYPVAVPTAGLKVTFTARLAGGSGGNGLTFALLNPATSTATSVGKPGYALGFGALAGVSVALDTVHTTDDGSRSSAYLCVSAAGSPALSSIQVARGIPPLRVGFDIVSVQITPNQAGPLISVWLDGELILRQVVPQLPPTALLAFTGATGAATDVHLVRDVAISTAS